MAKSSYKLFIASTDGDSVIGDIGFMSMFLGCSEKYIYNQNHTDRPIKKKDTGKLYYIDVFEE